MKNKNHITRRQFIRATASGAVAIGTISALLPTARTVADPPADSAQAAPAPETKDIGLQLADNPPMQTITTTPPPPVTDGKYEERAGFKIITTLEEFRTAIKKDGQKIRMKPGVYRATSIDPPTKSPLVHEKPGKDGLITPRDQEHIFCVTGSNNYFDLRGVVFETPVSVQSKLSARAHVASSWDINGANNTFEGGYFRNVLDKPYPQYHVSENEFAVCNDNNTFVDCTFVIKGSVPYGYSDFYGKGGPNFGPLNKHAFMAIVLANNTKILGCKIFMQSFGHCFHFHSVDGVWIERSLICGTLRPTNDIFKEVAGRAKDYDFNVMYRGPHPIPHDDIIPLTEDGVRSYDNVRNIVVIDTTVTRTRGCFQLCGPGDYTLENVTVLEAGDFSYDVSAGDQGKVVMKNCRSDVAYNPVFNLTRGELPKNAYYEVIILSPAEDIQATSRRASLGVICGDHCTFILRDGTTRPLPPEVNYLNCAPGKMPLKDSTVTNYTKAKLILSRKVSNCVIKSVGPVEDHGKNNSVVIMESAAAK
jgi:hypothetical protein